MAKPKRKRVGPEKWGQWLKEHIGAWGQYAQFIKRGDLVFDIGANRGMKTYAFRKLGARVVAVEPLVGVRPAFIPHLRYVFKDDKMVTIVPLALSDKIGQEVTLIVHKVFPGYSSMSREWMDKIPLKDEQVERRVQTTTLDALIEKHGVPQFVKIDVEGSESLVLRGLSHAIPALSFEFHHRLIADTMICFERLHSLEVYEFNWLENGTPPFVLPKWVMGHAMARKIKATPESGKGSWGDIFARRAK